MRIRREYEIRRDRKELYALYELKKDQEKKLASVRTLIAGKKAPTGIRLIDILWFRLKNRRSLKAARPFSYLYKKSRLDLRAEVIVGIGDVFDTALLCGWLAAAGRGLCAAFSRRNKTFRITVSPSYNKRFFSLRANCIIAISPANIIIGYFIYKIKIRGKKHASD
jgi:hypothetical protein